MSCAIKIVSFFLLLIVPIFGDFINPPLVQIDDGKLIGHYRTSRLNRTIISFESIPFAEPPVGPLRFAAPIPNKPWNGTLNATQVHPICAQRNLLRPDPVIAGQEDCLFLNVHSPNLTAKLPVLVYIHGGGFFVGTGNSKSCDPAFLLDHDVVLVTGNYRLGVYGFLSTGDAASPGNNGLKDQVLYLQWVQKNIASFGGDPNQVTIFGQSAGGVSVEYHMLSPLSKGLFSKGISESGTTHNNWGVAAPGEPLANTLQLAKALNCPTNNSFDLVNCIRQVPTDVLTGQDQIFFQWAFDPFIPFKPTIEPDLPGAFITELPEDILKSGDFYQVPWITGINSQEGCLRGAFIYGQSNLSQQLDANFSKIAVVLEYYETASNTSDVTNKIQDFYLRKNGGHVDESTRFDIVNIITDPWFLVSATIGVDLVRQFSSQPVWYYHFDHVGVASFSAAYGDDTRIYGACHGDELQYLFPLANTTEQVVPFRPQDIKMIEILTKIWTDFATYGVPTPSPSDLIPNNWDPVKTANLEHFYIRAEEQHMSSHKYIYPERVEFWKKLYLEAFAKPYPAA